MAKTKIQVVSKFGGYILRENGILSFGRNDWDVTGAIATFSVGPHKYGKTAGNAVLFGAMAGATDNTECFVTVRWPNGFSVTMAGLARFEYSNGQHIAKAIRDMSGLSPQQVQQQSQPYWNAQTGRWELNGQYWNGSVWELI